MPTDIFSTSARSAFAPELEFRDDGSFKPEPYRRTPIPGYPTEIHGARQSDWATEWMKPVAFKPNEPNTSASKRSLPDIDPELIQLDWMKSAECQCGKEEGCGCDHSGSCCDSCAAGMTCESSDLWATPAAGHNWTLSSSWIQGESWHWQGHPKHGAKYTDEWTKFFTVYPQFPLVLCLPCGTSPCRPECAIEWKLCRMWHCPDDNMRAALDLLTSKWAIKRRMDMLRKDLDDCCQSQMPVGVGVPSHDNPPDSGLIWPHGTVPPCPATEFGASSSFNWKKDENPLTGLFGHKGTCYRSIPNGTRMGQQCCYNKEGRLIQNALDGAGSVDLVSPEVSVAGHLAQDEVLSVWLINFLHTAGKLEYMAVHCCLAKKGVPSGTRGRPVSEATIINTMKECRSLWAKMKAAFRMTSKASVLNRDLDASRKAAKAICR